MEIIENLIEKGIIGKAGIGEINGITVDEKSIKEVLVSNGFKECRHDENQNEWYHKGNKVKIEIQGTGLNVYFLTNIYEKGIETEIDIHQIQVNGIKLKYGIAGIKVLERGKLEREKIQKFIDDIKEQLFNKITSDSLLGKRFEINIKCTVDVVYRHFG